MLPFWIDFWETQTQQNLLQEKHCTHSLVKWWESNWSICQRPMTFYAFVWTWKPEFWSSTNDH